ncbi:MAG: hypothetical protein ACREM8_05915, partial [Vulcanimicrobiaceae bacterium]
AWLALSVPLFVGTLLLAGCGGGGSSGGSVPSGPPGGIKSAGVQRSVTQSALAGAQSQRLAAIFASPTGTSALSYARLAQTAQRHALSTMPCANNSIVTSNPISGTQTAVEVKTFYDGACTMLMQDLVGTVTLVSTNLSVTAVVTSYGVTGAVTGYEKVSVAGSQASSQQNVTVTASAAVDASTPPFANAGLSCVVAAGTASCGLGATADSAQLTQELGATVNFAITAATGSGGTALNLTGTEVAYTGALNALALAQGSGTTWTITGGTQVASATLSGGFTYSGSGVLVAGTTVVTDTADDATVMLVAATNGGVTGTVKQTSTGQVVATFTIDANGNGAVAYGNGTTGTITGYYVVS